MWTELMVRVFGGASLALLVLAGLFTSARALADPPNGWATCSAVCGAGCPVEPPCPTEACVCQPGYDCNCRLWADEDTCVCAF